MSFYGTKGKPYGIAPLNDLGKIPATLLADIDSLSIADGSVSNSLFQLIPNLAGVSGNIQAQIDAIISGTSFRGGYDASSNLFPSTGGSGPSGAVEAGNNWAITAEGTLGGTFVIIGTTITALINSPGQIASNWSVPVDQVISVFGRKGLVAPEIGDYDVSQVTGAAPLDSPVFVGTPTAPILNLTNNTNFLVSGSTNTMTHTMASLTAPRIFTLPDANSNTIQPSSAPTNQFATGINNDGVISYAQPSFANISGIADITQGGSGQTTANAALNAFLPSQSGQNGKVLGTDGINSSWVTTSTGSVTSVSVATANGFAGTVATATTTPAISIQTSVTGILKGNGTSVVAAVATDIPTTNVLSSATNTMTSNVNGVSSNTTIINTNILNSSTNTLTSIINGIPSITPIINSNALALSTTTLTSSVNGIISSTVQVSPSGQSISSTITFNTLTEVLLAVAPNINAIGIYILRLVDGINELNVKFTMSGNIFSSYTQSSIQILEVNDSAGIINATNISSYLLFRGYLRTDTPNSYFAVTVSTPYTLLYNNPITMTVYQNGASYLNENFTITNMITTDISNLINLAPANLIFKIKTAYIPITTYTPQGYLYVPGSASGAIFQYRINNLTGAITALTPASFTTTNPYKIAVTQLRNFIYGIATGSNNIFQFAINPASGILSALVPATVAGPSVPTGIVVDPTDRFVYVCGFGTGQFNQFSITKSTGQLVAIPAPPTAAAGMQDLIVHPSGKWLYAINSSASLIYQYSIDQTTGALTVMGTTLSTDSGPVKIVAHPSGLYVYVLANTGNFIDIYNVNPNTGILTASVTPRFAVGLNSRGICISANGKFIYYSSQTSNAIFQSTITLATGNITTPTSSLAVSGARECCIDFSGSYLYVVSNSLNQVNTFLINQTTGAITAVGAGIATGTNVNNIIAA